MMTVAELIEKIKDLPPDTSIFMADCGVVGELDCAEYMPGCQELWLYSKDYFN